MGFYNVSFGFASIKGNVSLRCFATVSFLKLSVKRHFYTVGRDEFK